MAFTNGGSFSGRSIEKNEPVKYDSFFISIVFRKNYYSKINCSGGQNLFALSCDQDGSSGSKVGVDTMYLVSLQDYNNSHKINDTLNDIILTNYRNYNSNSNNFFPLKQYIEENKDKIIEDLIDIKLTEPPTMESEFDFKLIYVLKDGKRFEEVTNKVKLTK